MFENNIPAIHCYLSCDFQIVEGEAAESYQFMDEICQRMGVKNCICSIVNHDTMQIEYLNFRDNKRKTFIELYKSKTVDEFYTDNMVDKPMIDIAKKAYFVKGNKIKRIK